jgi:AcrR family transcriptional regulator
VPRVIPPQRFDELVRKATEVFIARGYRRTQMADVAEAVGVSKATLYLYVESKEALFALCLRYASRSEALELPAELPVRAPAAGATAARMGKSLDGGKGRPRLAEALGRAAADDIGQELRGVLDEFYTTLETHCRKIKLVDRCWDHPELGSVWQQGGREAPRQQLAEYFELRMRAGQIRFHETPRLAARIAVETISTWAMHIKWDPAPEPLDPVESKQAVIEFIARGLLSDTALARESATGGTEAC